MSTAFEKQKLCHSLGRPSRSDFVHFEVIREIIVIGDIIKVVVDRPLGSFHPKHKDILPYKLWLY